MTDKEITICGHFSCYNIKRRFMTNLNLFTSPCHMFFFFFVKQCQHHHIRTWTYPKIK